MPYWLVEGDLTLYAILAAVGIVCAAIWLRTGRRKYAIVAGAAAVAILTLSLLDRFVESDREQMIRKVQDIADGVQSRNFDRVFRHVSDGFRRGTFDKAQFRSFAQEASHRRNVTEFQAWGFVPGDVSRQNRRGELEFSFKIRGNWSAGTEYFVAKTAWTMDSDGEWRLQNFDVFNPFTDATSPIQIPGWPR
jgi:hypothetical protein